MSRAGTAAVIPSAWRVCEPRGRSPKYGVGGRLQDHLPGRMSPGILPGGREEWDRRRYASRPGDHPVRSHARGAHVDMSVCGSCASSRRRPTWHTPPGAASLWHDTDTSNGPVRRQPRGAVERFGLLATSTSRWDTGKAKSGFSSAGLAVINSFFKEGRRTKPALAALAIRGLHGSSQPAALPAGISHISTLLTAPTVSPCGDFCELRPTGGSPRPV